MTSDLDTWWKGQYKRHDHCSKRNLINAVWFLVGLSPGIGLAIYTLRNKDAFLHDSPLLFANYLFLVNIDIFLYIGGLIFKSFWVIDPYWSMIPEMFGFLWR